MGLKKECGRPCNICSDACETNIKMECDLDCPNLAPNGDYYLTLDCRKCTPVLERKVVTVDWTPEDVLEICPDLSKEAAERFLKEKEVLLEQAMVEAGREFLEDRIEEFREQLQEEHEEYARREDV